MGLFSNRKSDPAPSDTHTQCAADYATGREHHDLNGNRDDVNAGYNQQPADGIPADTSRRMWR